jgi:hypothetical protein
VASPDACSDEPELVECRWTQPVDEPTDVGDRGFDARRRSVEQLVAGCWVAGQHASCGFDHQDRAGERRPEAVVQVAAESPPLFFARGDEPLA